MNNNETTSSTPPITAPTRGNQPRRAPKERPQARWSKTIVNFWVDCLLLVVFLTLIWVSAVLRFLFPVGPTERNWQLWGGGVEFWRDVQFTVLCVFALGILLHVMLHWSWICGVVTKHVLRRPPSRDDGSQTLIGVGVLLSLLHLLGGALLLAWLCLRQNVSP